MGFKKRINEKWRKYRRCALNSYIYSAYNHKKINDKVIYFESKDGNDFTGNILRILEELSSGKYGNFKIYVYAKKEIHQKIISLQKNYNLKIDKLISNPDHATRVLEYAKYIFTDSGIRPNYIKRPGQIFVNTWHGTPLKLMGIDNLSEEHRVANIQHPLLSSDYLLFPNDYMCEKMTNAYMIDDVFPGKILLEGYPRNSVFFDEKRKNSLKEIFNWNNKEIFVYMPTYRGILKNRKYKQQKYDIEKYLLEIDKELTDNQVLLVKLHLFNRNHLDFKKFKHCKPFPENYETYDILNMADVLITDYSSVFFDFANSKRKIIIFNYDEKEYLYDHGLYMDLDELPFPKVQTTHDLIKELNSPKNYDDENFIKKYCKYDHPDAVKNLCKHIFTEDKVCVEKNIENHKENILIYVGTILNNGITSSLISLLNNVDLDEYNYFISFRTWDKEVEKNHATIFKMIPDKVKFLPLRSKIKPTLIERIKLDDFLKSEDKKDLSEEVKNLFKREYEKYYHDIKFKAIINFNGYKKNENLMFSTTSYKNSIWVHSDMIQEQETRKNQNLNLLNYCYSNYDNVVVVSNDLIEPTTKSSGRSDNIKVVHNLCNFDNIINNSEKPITINKTTEIETYSSNGLNKVLNSYDKKIITIGRFSHEKGHERLMLAFDKFCDDYPNAQLIIIGGHGDLYKKTRNLKYELKHWKNITTIKWIANPMPILKKCDLFILPSFYEGWGMVIMEADALNVPVIATDVVGTQWIRDYNGYLAENSEEGILKALYDFIDGNVGKLNIDFEKFNENAISEFYSILEDN